MSKPTAASLRYLLPNVSFTDSLWHMALTVQLRAKLVNAITSFPSVAKGTEKKKKKKRVEHTEDKSCTMSRHLNTAWIRCTSGNNLFWCRKRVFFVTPQMHTQALVIAVNKNIPPCTVDWSVSPRRYLKVSEPSAERGLAGQRVDLHRREWHCFCSNQICDILRKGTIVQPGWMQHRWRRVEYTIWPSLRSAELGNKVLSEKKRITCWDIVQKHILVTDQVIIGLVRLLGGAHSSLKAY